jgi:hypothetical protein
MRFQHTPNAPARRERGRCGQGTPKGPKVKSSRASRLDGVNGGEPLPVLVSTQTSWLSFGFGWLGSVSSMLLVLASARVPAGRNSGWLGGQLAVRFGDEPCEGRALMAMGNMRRLQALMVGLPWSMVGARTFASITRTRSSRGHSAHLRDRADVHEGRRQLAS